MTSRLRPLLFGLLASMAALASTNAKEPDTHFPEKLPDELFAGKPYLVTVAPEFQRYFTAPIFLEVGQGLGTEKNPFKTHAIIYDGIHAPELPAEILKQSPDYLDSLFNKSSPIEKSVKYSYYGWLFTKQPYNEVLKILHPKSPIRKHPALKSESSLNTYRAKISNQLNPKLIESRKTILRYRLDHKEMQYLLSISSIERPDGKKTPFTHILALHNNQWMAYECTGDPTIGILGNPINRAIEVATFENKPWGINFTEVKPEKP